MKKSISLLLTIIVCFSMSISAFAADEDNFVIPKDIKETTITYQIDPNDVDGIQPFI